jgi:SecD/SecF fusion protein
VATAGAPIDVPPPEKARRRGRITEPEDPQRGVSQTEFEEMVRDLHVDAPPQRTATKEPEPAPDLAPEDLVLKDDKSKRAPKPKRPRNRRHGRSR